MTLSIPEAARAILQGASSTYEETEVTGGEREKGGPWPTIGDHDALFRGFLVVIEDFFYDPGEKKYDTMPDGIRIQCLYSHIDGNGEEAEWKGEPTSLPPNFRETIQTLPRDKGVNCQKAIAAGLARIKGAIQHVLGRPAGPDFLADLEEANNLVESGEMIGLVVNVVSNPYDDSKGRRQPGYRDYVNGTVDISDAVSTATEIASAVQ